MSMWMIFMTTATQSDIPTKPFHHQRHKRHQFVAGGWACADFSCSLYCNVFVDFFRASRVHHSSISSPILGVVTARHHCLYTTYNLLALLWPRLLCVFPWKHVWGTCSTQALEFTTFSLASEFGLRMPQIILHTHCATLNTVWHTGIHSDVDLAENQHSHKVERLVLGWVRV